MTQPVQIIKNPNTHGRNRSYVPIPRAMITAPTSAQAHSSRPAILLPKKLTTRNKVLAQRAQGGRHLGAIRYGSYGPTARLGGPTTPTNCTGEKWLEKKMISGLNLFNLVHWLLFSLSSASSFIRVEPSRRRPPQPLVVVRRHSIRLPPPPSLSRRSTSFR